MVPVYSQSPGLLWALVCLYLYPVQVMSRSPGGLPQGKGQPAETFLLASSDCPENPRPVYVCAVGGALPIVTTPLLSISQGRGSPQKRPSKRFNQMLAE